MNIYCFSTLSFAKLQFKSVINKAFHKHGVASFTDAWIETIEWGISKDGKRSHLLQMRGLKPIYIIYRNFQCMSHLLQMRGLKLQLLLLLLQQVAVASFTDAWIETRIRKLLRVVSMVASFTDAWIETRYVNHLGNKECRIFYRCVD